MTEVKEHAGILGAAILGGIRLIVREEVRAALKITGSDEADRLLDAEEAAAILGVSKDWVYRNRRRLRFTRKVGPKALRFSHKGIQRWIESRKL